MDYQHIETLKPPRMYGHAQIRQALLIAYTMNRGRLVLTEPPRP